MINNDKIFTLDDSLLVINSKSMYNYLAFYLPLDIHLQAYEANTNYGQQNHYRSQ